MSAYKPQFKGPIEGWVVNHLSRNYWRVERTQERQDVMQEAYLVFLKVTARYPGVEARHFMALFKTSWSNHFTDLANADTSDRVNTSFSHAVTFAEGGRETEYMEHDYMGDSDNDGALAVMLRQAPAEVMSVLNLFLNAPQELLEVALGQWQGADRRCKAGGSKKINQLLGLPEQQDVMSEVERYFGRSK